MDDGFGRSQSATNWSKHTIRIEASKSNDDYPNGPLVFLNKLQEERVEGKTSTILSVRDGNLN
jgi:hypothetical protein